MSSYQSILENPPFQVSRDKKRLLFLEGMKTLCAHHYAKCDEYKRILDALNVSISDIATVEDVPFIPVRLFKMFDLKSVDPSEVFKVMTSSGTTGQAVSKIFLDKETASNQQRTIVKIVSEFSGQGRMPMLVIDAPGVLKDRKMFSARGAAILGFSIFGTNKAYALNDQLELDLEVVEKFLEAHKGKDIFLFGFTFVVWQHFYKELKKRDKYLDLSRAVLIHGGGWKKMASEAVSHSIFKDELNKVCGIKRVHDYYGMIEQTGCIYMECDHGYLHASSYSDVIVRNPSDFSVCANGEKGLIQLLSFLPTSYPGQSILSEDEGIIFGEDDCSCGRKGKYFKVLGRIKNAEIRGCSDTYERR